MNMLDRNYIDINEIKDLYEKLGIDYDDIEDMLQVKKEYFSYEEEDIFSRRWDSSFFANTRY